MQEGSSSRQQMHAHIPASATNSGWKDIIIYLDRNNTNQGGTQLYNIGTTQLYLHWRQCM